MRTKILVLDAIGSVLGIKEIDSIREILGEELHRFELIDHDVQLQPLQEEQIANVDKVIISGSPASVYDNKVWMQSLEAALSLIIKYRKPTLAVCFGAQFVAQFLGSLVTKNPAGTEFGSIHISLTEDGHKHPFLTGFHNDSYVYSSHNDYIGSLPAGAKLLAYNENSAIQAFQYESILATQFHPDISIQVMRILLQNRQAQYLTSGFLKSLDHYDQVYEGLTYGEQGHAVLRRFLNA